MEKLSKYVLNKALQAGICNEWAMKIAVASGRGELLNMYCRGIDFCLEKNFPSNDDLVRLGGEELQAHGIFVDSPAISSSEFTVLLGASSGSIRVEGFAVSQLFVKHQSTAKVTVSDNGFMVVDCFDTTHVDVTASGNSKVLINVYGQAQVAHNSSGNAYIKVIQKNKTTY